MITKFNFKDRTIKSYAIRKLTVSECLSLMGVRQSVISIMRSTVAEAKRRVANWTGKGNDDDLAVSNSQGYKQAGNSIVVDVIVGIVENVYYTPDVKNKTADGHTIEEDGQLTLF